MFDKVAAALSAVALGAGIFAVYKMETKPQPVPMATIEQMIASRTSVPVVPRADIETLVADEIKTGLTKQAASAVAGTGTDSELLDKAIAAYLRDNPEAIIASLEKYQRDQQLEQQRSQAERDIELVASNKEEIFKDGYSLIAGNPDGDITMVEFSDYNCGYCKRAHTEVAKFIEADGNIKLVLKEFPILGPGSTIAARAALASAMQDGGEKYTEFNDSLMKHRGSHNEASVMKVAEEVGLDVDQLQVDMKSPEIDEMVKRTMDLAQTLSINGTPAFIIGNQVVRGFVPAAELKRLTEAARSS